MAWGDTFKSAWNAATDTARNAVGALATGEKNVAGWAKNKVSQGIDIAKQTATWTAKKTTEVTQWAKDTYDSGKKNLEQLKKNAVQAYDEGKKKLEQVKQSTVQAYDAGKKKLEQGKDWVKDKATKTSTAVKETYQNVKKQFTDAVAGTAIVACKYLKKGLDGAEAERTKLEKDKDLLTKFFDNVTPSIENNWSKSYRRTGRIGNIDKANNKLKNEGLSVGVSHEWLKNKSGDPLDDRLLYYGDENYNLNVGSYGASVKTGVSYNKTKREWNADIIDASVHAALVSGKGKQTLGEADFFEFNEEIDLVSVEGKGNIGATWGKKIEVVAEAEVSADLVKGTVAGGINLTPKSIWDNTVGRIPFFGKAPAWLDHGLKLGAEGEAGIGAGIGGEVGLKDGMFVLGGEVGLGLKLGLKLGIGFK